MLAGKCPQGTICAYREVAPNATGVCKKQCDEGDVADMRCVGSYSGALTYYECVGGRWESRVLQNFDYCIEPLEDKGGNSSEAVISGKA